MDIELAKQRVHDARVARLGTITPDGRPHLVPCCFALIDDIVYTAIDSKPKTTLALRRIENVLACSATSLLVDHYEEDWSALWWVRLDGVASVLGSTPETESAKHALTTKYSQYRRVAIPGPVVSLEVSKWVSWP